MEELVLTPGMLISETLWWLRKRGYQVTTFSTPPLRIRFISAARRATEEPLEAELGDTLVWDGQRVHVWRGGRV